MSPARVGLKTSNGRDVLGAQVPYHPDTSSLGLPVRTADQARPLVNPCLYGFMCGPTAPGRWDVGRSRHEYVVFLDRDPSTVGFCVRSVLRSPQERRETGRNQAAHSCLWGGYLEDLPVRTSEANQERLLLRSSLKEFGMGRFSGFCGSVTFVNPVPIWFLLVRFAIAHNSGNP